MEQCSQCWMPHGDEYVSNLWCNVSNLSGWHYRSQSCWIWQHQQRADVLAPRWNSRAVLHRWQVIVRRVLKSPPSWYSARYFSIQCHSHSWTHCHESRLVSTCAAVIVCVKLNVILQSTNFSCASNFREYHIIIAILNTCLKFGLPITKFCRHRMLTPLVNIFGSE